MTFSLLILLCWFLSNIYNCLTQLSFRVVETLILLGEKLGCYKISLECKDPLLSYYTQFGFKLEEGQNYLCKRFYHWELSASFWVFPEKILIFPCNEMIFFNPSSLSSRDFDFSSREIFPHNMCRWYVDFFSVITQSFRIIRRSLHNSYIRT